MRQSKQAVHSPVCPRQISRLWAFAVFYLSPRTHGFYLGVNSVRRAMGCRFFAHGHAIDRITTSQGQLSKTPFTLMCQALRISCSQIPIANDLGWWTQGPKTAILWCVPYTLPIATKDSRHKNGCGIVKRNKVKTAPFCWRTKLRARSGLTNP